jgi:hypothetical protein
MGNREYACSMTVFLAASFAVVPSAVARQASEDPASVESNPARYVPARTEWGDPDLRGTWPIHRVAEANIPLQRPEKFGDRAWLSDEEFAERLEEARKADASYANEVEASGTVGLAEWLQSTPFGRRASLIVSPANGRLPPMTPRGRELFDAGRTSWNEDQPIDWVTDLDAYDRCVSRGFPASMLPYPSNDGIRVFQSPGFVVLQLEVLGTRIIPIGEPGRWPPAVRSWLGDSRGRWEGDTIVVETSNMIAGDSATRDVWRRAGSPVSGRGWGIVPMSEKAKATERLTMTGPGAIAYRVTYSDTEVFTAPWTVEMEWTRDDTYRMYEFACHEGNVSIRDMIESSRAQRKLDGSGADVYEGKGK